MKLLIESILFLGIMLVVVYSFHSILQNYFLLTENVEMFFVSLFTLVIVVVVAILTD